MSRSTISVFKLLEMFPTEESARLFLEDKRWKNETRCPYCKSKKITTRKGNRTGYYRCQECNKEFTVRTNTVFERSHIPLNKWIFAFYLVMTSRKGISSMQLSKELGVTQKSAWFMLQRIREACKRDDDDDFMGGIVEIDETYVGGKEKNKHSCKRVEGTQGRSVKTKVAVVGMRSRNGDVRALAIDGSVSVETMQGILNKNIEKGSTISTDEAGFYKSVVGYNHILVNHSVGQFVNEMACTNGIESVWSVLKRGYYGTFHHFSKKHIKGYIDEFMFRMNEGNVRNHIMERIEALIFGAIGKRLTYRELTR